MDFEYGSYWRKWDLHVHTPMSVLCNNYVMSDIVSSYSVNFSCCFRS